jgi:4-amino-4-deoxy-L-arabinose transferase-like glycosyltransferase
LLTLLQQISLLLTLLLQTGKDEHGNSWPIHFQSFNDYKPGLYFYIVLPFVYILGLTEMAVRLPGALLGVISVIFLYYLVLRFKFEKVSSQLVALISAFFLAISPWHIHFSRGGWEVNAAATFIIISVWAFFVSLRRPMFLYLAAFFAVLSLYTYHAARIEVPLLFVCLFFVFIFRSRFPLKYIGFSICFSLVLLLPLGSDLLKGNVLSRASGVGLFADTGPLARANELRGEHENFNGILPKLLHNKPISYSLAFVSNWGKHFSGDFLFISGEDIQRNKIPEMGMMYLIDGLFIAFGVFFLLKFFSKTSLFIFLFLFLAPIPAALTFQSPHALRSHIMIIPLTIIGSYGAAYLFSFFLKQKYIFLMLFSLTMSWSLIRYLHLYYVHMASFYPYSSQYGVKELVTYLEGSEKNRAHVIVTTRYDQPYILFLFYSRYSPQKFQQEHVLTPRDQFGFSTVTSYGRYTFAPIDYYSMKKDHKGDLLVGIPSDFPDGTYSEKDIVGQGGFKYFRIVPI